MSTFLMLKRIKLAQFCASVWFGEKISCDKSESKYAVNKCRRECPYSIYRNFVIFPSFIVHALPKTRIFPLSSISAYPSLAMPKNSRHCDMGRI